MPLISIKPEMPQKEISYRHYNGGRACAGPMLEKKKKKKKKKDEKNELKSK